VVIREFGGVDGTQTPSVSEVKRDLRRDRRTK